MEKTILVAGDVAMDILLNVPYAPNEGRTVLSKDVYSFTPGGSGAYTAVAARRAGCGVCLCSRIGDDEQGERLIRYFKDEDVNISQITPDYVNQTALNVYLLEQYGLGGKVCYGGAAARLNADDVEGAFGIAPDLFVTSLKAEHELIKRAASLTRKGEIPFILDASGAYENCRLSDVMGVDILIASEDDAELLTGIRPNSTDNFMRACIALCDKLPLRFVVLKLGKRGAYIYDGKYCELLMAPTLQCVDTTAEHECFVGSFCARFIKEFDVYDATNYALAASAIASSRVGGFASIPNNEEIVNIMY